MANCYYGARARGLSRARSESLYLIPPWSNGPRPKLRQTTVGLGVDGGSGNHFLEIQTDEVDRLWLMIHSGSRALGQAIRDHHLTRAQRIEGRFHALDAQSDSGREYLRDAAWARRYAAASRKAIAIETEALLNKTLGAKACWETLIMWRA